MGNSDIAVLRESSSCEESGSLPGTPVLALSWDYGHPYCPVPAPWQGLCCAGPSSPGLQCGWGQYLPTHYGVGRSSEIRLTWPRAGWAPPRFLPTGPGAGCEGHGPVCALWEAHPWPAWSSGASWHVAFTRSLWEQDRAKRKTEALRGVGEGWCPPLGKIAAWGLGAAPGLWGAAPFLCPWGLTPAHHPPWLHLPPPASPAFSFPPFSLTFHLTLLVAGSVFHPLPFPLLCHAHTYSHYADPVAFYQVPAEDI